MTRIEWTHPPGYRGETWNPSVGCERHSPGCLNCYAERQAIRHINNATYRGLVRIGKHGPTWTGIAREVPERLTIPLHWRAPRCVFVDSMSDLFHDDITREFIISVFAVMAACSRHLFIVLTKRAERMQSIVADSQFREAVYNWMLEHPADCGVYAVGSNGAGAHPQLPEWPLPNVILGVSAENQEWFDKRVWFLERTPATVRAVSLEPLLGPVSVRGAMMARDGAAECMCGHGHGFTRCPNYGQVSKVCHYVGCPCVGFRRKDRWWFIAGGESGPRARPCNVEWLEDIVRQARDVGAQCFIKQIGSVAFDPREAGRDTDDQHPGGAAEDPDCRLAHSDMKGGNIDDFPEAIRVRQWPRMGAS